MDKESSFVSKGKGILKSDAAKTILASLLSILIGLFFGGIIILLVALFSEEISLSDAFDGLRLVFFGIFSKGRDAVNGNLLFGFNPANFGNMLFRATPIILTGLSVAIAFKTGLFNIGAPGQYLMGTAASLLIALSIPKGSLPSLLIWFLALLGGMAAGAFWGAIPGALRAYLKINEVIACIMTNWIAASLVTWIFENSRFRNGAEGGKVGYIMKTSMNSVSTPKLLLDKIFPGSQINGGIFVAVIMAILVYILITKTTLGFEMKACGSNSHAANYVGIKEKRKIVLSMTIAGALSGAAASLYYLSGNTEFFWSTYQSLPKEGFNGIPVALLAGNNPIGVIFTGCFMSMLNISGQQLKNFTSYNEYVTDIIIAVIVYLSAFSLIIKGFISKKRAGKTIKERKNRTASAVNLATADIETPKIENEEAD